MIGVQKTVQEKRQHRDDAFSYLKRMMYAENEEDFQMAYDELVMWVEQHEQEWDANDLIQYIDDHYLGKKEKWSRAWRQHNYHIDTNNFIESWHQSLKEVYLKGLKRQHVNVLVYILWDVVLPSVMTDHAQKALMVSPAVMTRAERQRNNLARDIPEDVANAMVTSYTESAATVMSFTDNTKSYTITINDNRMTACTCLDFERSHALCKHLYLLHRVKRTCLLDMRINQTMESTASQESVMDEEMDQEHAIQEAIRSLQAEVNSFATQANRATPAMFSFNMLSTLIRIREQVRSLSSTLYDAEIPNQSNRHQNRF
ncbi:hypothetical protein BX666DRAFT_2145619 [Dichotomocladium elegans]|nr:hypothetical protein BX666DRAFT_2145619 [Dichotomocladium elegans]